MKYFINLTSKVINKLHIIEIVKRPHKYEIHMSNNTGYGILMFGSGSINTRYNIIEIYKNRDKQDYETITNLIKDGF